MINVWITEKNNSKDQYCLIERANNRGEVMETLDETILTDGAVPNWIKSIDFYEDGDFPTETYTSGDKITK